MAIGYEDAGPSGIVEIIKLHAPAQPCFYSCKSCAISDVVKVIVTAVEIKSSGIVAENRLNNVLITAVRKVVRRSTHTGLLRSVVAVRNAGLFPNFGECSVMIVVVEEACGGVTSDINIGPAVVVEIRG